VAVIGPLAPPVHGHVVTTERILASRSLNSEFRIVHVDISDHRGFENLGRLDLRNVVLAVRHAWSLVVVLVRERPAIVYVPLAQNLLGLGRNLLFVVLGLIGRARLVAHAHGGGLESFVAEAPWWFRVPARALLSRSAAVVVMSDSQRQSIESVIPAERVPVVRHGTESVEIPPRERRNGPLRALYASSALHEDKGLRTLLEVASEAQRAQITSGWDIVGGWLSEGARTESQAIVDGVPGISFRGTLGRDELLDAFASADVFVFPTQAVEGFGLVRIEAMAAGLPVITTEAGGAREIVRDGVDGFVVRYDSPEDILTRLDQLRSDPDRRAEMGHRARERQRALFDSRSFEAALAGVWRDVAARPSGEAE
jgi:glycosyltransferase involved in cell wall biosynthesis